MDSDVGMTTVPLKLNQVQIKVLNDLVVTINDQCEFSTFYFKMSVHYFNSYFHSDSISETNGNLTCI
jgi:hypothetical protein